MYARPSQENEEELLQMQEDFYKNLAENCVNPAARLIKTDDNPKNKEPENDPSQMETVPNINVVPEAVLGSIIEKDVLVSTKCTFPKSTMGFPQACRRKFNQTKGKGGSIFAQQMSNKESESLSVTPKSEQMEIDQFEGANSQIITGPESEVIHKENLALLNQMSPSDILKEKQKLMATLDPKMLEFITSKRKQNFKQNSKIVRNAKGDASPPKRLYKNPEDIPSTSTTTGTSLIIEDIPTVPEILAFPNADKWLHFDNLELSKLEWMKSIKKPAAIKSGDAYEARFDFAGWLQPYLVDDPINDNNRVLFHHGEEPGRPGYTLQELLHLCRSSVVQQKILALNSIANLLALYNTGVYDGIVDLPTEQIFFVIRFALDENVLPVVTASLRALRNLFFYQVDEMCLDNLLGFNCGLIQPILQYNKIDQESSKNKEEELNDQQMAETNLIKCLLRTDILVRLRYILTTLRPPSETVILCFELLIRIVRDSQQAFTQVFNHEDFMEMVFRDFISTYPNFLIKASAVQIYSLRTAIKFLRVMVSRSQTIANGLMGKYDLLSYLLVYLTEDAPSNEIIKLQTEVMYLLAALVYFSPSFEKFIPFQAILLRLLNYHARATNISENSSYVIQGHVAAVLCVVTQIAKKFTHLVVEPFLNLLSEGFFKWSAQVSSLSTFKCGQLQIIASLCRCWASVETLKCPQNSFKALLTSSGFDQITQNIKCGSNLLCSKKPHNTGAALDSVQASIWDTGDHVVPVLLTDSCMPFLSGLTALLRANGDSESILTFIRHSNVQKYFKHLNTSSRFYLTSNWFTRIEAEFVMNSLQMSVVVAQALTEIEAYMIYCIAMKCIYIFTTEFKNDVGDLLRNIIFNRSFFPSDALLRNLHLESDNNVFSSSLSDLHEIRSCYLNSLGFEKMEFLLMTKLALQNKQTGILPSDWIFLPIIALYSNYANKEAAGKSSSSNDKDEIQVVYRCLQWTIIFEFLFPKLMNIINVTERYCRLSCIFLCSNNMFLESEIHKLLEICLKSVLNSEYIKNLDFDKEIQGLVSFQDFYTLLLDQYQGVSYGDVLFANFILVPLTQEQNVKWRKIFWSEYAGVTQILGIKEEQLLVPYDKFLLPTESDMSVLKCYHRALKFGFLERSPLLKKIAQHHVQEYINSKKKP